MTLSNDERDELRSTARNLLARDSSAERVRATVAEQPGFDHRAAPGEPEDMVVRAKPGSPQSPP